MDRGHEEHDALLEWAGGSYEPGAFDHTKVSFDDPAERWRRAFQDPGSRIRVSVSFRSESVPEMRLAGNRRGFASLANVLLWLDANSHDFEFLPITQLPFVKAVGAVQLSIRLADEDPRGKEGHLARLDESEQYEWVLSDHGLRLVALDLHHAVAIGYDHCHFPRDAADAVDAEVLVIIDDAEDWPGGAEET